MSHDYWLPRYQRDQGFFVLNYGDHSTNDQLLNHQANYSFLLSRTNMRVFLRQMLVICPNVIMIRHSSDTTRVADMKNHSILDLILHILKPKTNFNLKISII